MRFVRGLLCDIGWLLLVLVCCVVRVKVCAFTFLYIHIRKHVCVLLLNYCVMLHGLLLLCVWVCVRVCVFFVYNARVWFVCDVLRDVLCFVVVLWYLFLCVFACGFLHNCACVLCL